MTFAPRIPPLPVADLDDAAVALRRRGGRLSQPRRQVLEALFAADGPVSAEYIAGGLGGATTPVELTSVYRALEHLEGLGVARHVHLGHGPGLYALARAEEREYLVCERCDRVTSVEAGRLDGVREQIREAFGYHARFSHFPIVGLCDACANANEGRAAAHGDHQHSHGHRVHAHPHTHEHAH
jgi:Fur family transcriptional regulator, ferric uptake regulator